MNVELLQDIKDGTGIKIVLRPTRRPAALAFVKGEVVAVSDATAQKWVQRGWAKATDRQPASQTRAEDAPPSGTAGTLTASPPQELSSRRDG